MPVYKMPHLQSWAFAEGQYALPAVGRHEVLWVDRTSLGQTAATEVAGQPVFIIEQPASPYVWVNFALPDNDKVQVIDSRSHEVVATLTPGKAILHMEFAPRGAEVWISVRDANAVAIYDTRTFEKTGEIVAVLREAPRIEPRFSGQPDDVVAQAEAIFRQQRALTVPQLMAFHAQLGGTERRQRGAIGR